MIHNLTLITGNKNKLNEFNKILKKTNIVLTNIDIDLPEIQAIDVETVVKQKLLHGYSLINKPIIVEDTGMYITSPPMNGFPGALIKYYYDKLTNHGICAKNGGDDACVETVIGYYDGENTHIFKGTNLGIISKEPKIGDHGFGWDAIFVPNGYDKSFAQIEPDIKNEMSMRKQALDKLINHFAALT
jgi:XTP/dITP diphosphohydrolase